MTDNPNDRIISRLNDLGLEADPIEDVMNLVSSNQLQPEPERPGSAQEAQDQQLLQQLRGSTSRCTSIHNMW